MAKAFANLITLHVVPYPTKFRRTNKIRILNPDGSWKEEPVASIGETLEKDQLEYLVDTQTQQIQGLQSELEQLRDWSNGSDTNGANVALSSLIRIVGDSAASTRQRIKAAAAVLGYKAQADVSEFVRKYLQSVCESTDIAIDYRIEAGELLRRHEAPRVTPESVRPAYSDSGGTEAGRTEAWRVYERWQLRKQIVLSTRNPPQPGWDDHLQRDTYAGPPEGNAMPRVRVVEDAVSSFRLLDNLMPRPGQRRRQRLSHRCHCQYELFYGQFAGPAGRAFDVEGYRALLSRNNRILSPPAGASAAYPAGDRAAAAVQQDDRGSRWGGGGQNSSRARFHLPPRRNARVI